MEVPLRVYGSKHTPTIKSIWEKLEYERVRECRKGDVVVDAGAGIGIFTVKAGMQVGGGGTVYAFEPEPENFKLLEENTANLPNVKVFNKALWSSSCQKTLYVDGLNWGGHGFYPSRHVKRSIAVDAVSLDEAINDRVNFLKIDVEGAELEVLKGAVRILNDHKPFIAVELHSKKLYDDVVRFLSDFGYEPYETNPQVKVKTHYFLTKNKGGISRIRCTP